MPVYVQKPALSTRNSLYWLNPPTKDSEMSSLAPASAATMLYYVMPRHKFDRPRRHVSWLESDGPLSAQNLSQQAVFDAVSDAVAHYPNDTVFDVRNDHMRVVASVVVGPPGAA